MQEEKRTNVLYHVVANDGRILNIFHTLEEADEFAELLKKHYPDTQLFKETIISKIEKLCG